MPRENSAAKQIAHDFVFPGKAEQSARQLRIGTDGILLGKTTKIKDRR